MSLHLHQRAYSSQRCSTSASDGVQMTSAALRRVHLGRGVRSGAGQGQGQAHPWDASPAQPSICSRPVVNCAASATSYHSNGSTISEGADDVENCVIIGSGPAGYTCAIYAARANLKPVVFEGLSNGRGGQLMGTTEVENFPGFPEGITGPDLMDRMRKQAERWGAELYTEDVEQVDLSRRPFIVRTADREIRTHSIVIATGASAKRLNLPSENAFWGKGISACAICDGASPLFKNREVAVVGGGDSAAEEAVYLTKYCTHVHLIVRGDKLRASKAMQDRALANSKVTVHYNTGIEDAYGDEVVDGLNIVNFKTGEQQKLPVKGLFYGIGHNPNSSLIKGQVELDAAGYIKVQHGVATNVEGVYSAGDLHDTEWRQAITAAGSGCMAALSVERYLTSTGLAREFKQPDTGNDIHHELPSANGSTTLVADVDEPDAFDINEDFHRGQYALRKLYHESERVIAVLYTAPTCGPCRTLKPIFKGVASEYQGKIHYVEIDIVQDSEIAEAAGITGTPTIQFFKDRDQVAVMTGVKMKSDYRRIIDAHVASAQMQRVAV